MGRKKILIAEDEELLRFLYEKELEDAGYEVVAVNNGREALHQLEKAKPDLVILDIAMPEMDGITTLNSILGKNRQVPVIFNTAFPQYKENFMTWGAEAYVVKSSDLSELKQTIRQVWRGGKRPDERKSSPRN